LIKVNPEYAQYRPYFKNISIFCIYFYPSRIKAIALDIIKEKVDMINNKQSPIADPEIEEYLATKDLNLTATTDNFEAFKDAEYVIISTPTNYDPEKNYFNTRTVEAVIANVLSINPYAVMIIKSTVPVGYTESIKEKFDVKDF